MGFHVRDEWADRHPSMSPANTGVGTAVVHHTASSGAEVAWASGRQDDYLRALEHSVTDHVAPGNSSPLIAIDYNELIFPDGEVWAGRGFAFQDAATYRFNTESVSWALIGNYDVNDVPAPMLTALAGRIQAASREGWLRPSPAILGHGDVGTFPTACPGRFMRARLPQLRTLVASGVTASAVTQKAGKMLRLISGDIRTKELWLTDWLDKRKVESLHEAAAIIQAGVTDGVPQVIWPQSYVDNIPVRT